MGFGCKYRQADSLFFGESVRNVWLRSLPRVRAKKVKSTAKLRNIKALLQPYAEARKLIGKPAITPATKSMVKVLIMIKLRVKMREGFFSLTTLL